MKYFWGHMRCSHLLEISRA
uniref:Uncharacterized protein n=1 Tax=Arundo donax TaxID=35708 RepID=A0A0A9AP84_ARUDO